MVRILVSMNDAFLSTIDKVAKNEQRTRSELIREALRSYMQKANRIIPKKAQNEAKILEDLLD